MRAILLALNKHWGSVAEWWCDNYPLVFFWGVWAVWLVWLLVAVIA